jgi:hypothetical protein
MCFGFFGIVPEIGIRALFFFVGYLGEFSLDVKDTSSRPRRGPLYP